ncbi:hypothetical protein MYO4S_00021 [Serratia phage 4S]|nr:hypothetical protein MYO4S_00021 [Serratia phage 4S]
MFKTNKIYRMTKPLYGQASYETNLKIYDYLEKRNALFFKVLDQTETGQVTLIESTKENEKIHLQQVRNALGQGSLDSIFWSPDLGEKGCLEVYEDPNSVDVVLPMPPSKEQVDDALKSISIASLVYRERQHTVDNLKVALQKAEQDLEDARSDFMGELVVYNTL